MAIEIFLYGRFESKHSLVIGVDEYTDRSISNKDCSFVPIAKIEGNKPETDDESSQTEEVPDPIKMEKSQQAKNIIINHITDVVLLKVQHCVSAAEMWTTLNKLYMETLFF